MRSKILFSNKHLFSKFIVDIAPLEEYNSSINREEKKTMMNRKNVMKRAWEIAKAASAKYGYSARSFFVMSLKMAWAEAKAPKKPVSERIEELEELGFKRWQKGNMDRLYINANMIGLTLIYYKTGNVKEAYWNGDRISNCCGNRYKYAKTFIDVKTGIVYSDYPELKEAAEKLAKIA